MPDDARGGLLRSVTGLLHCPSAAVPLSAAAIYFRMVTFATQFVKNAFNAACILTILFVLVALWHGLTAPLLLGLGVLFLFSAVFSLVVVRRFHWPSLCIGGGSLAAFVLIFFVPVWIAAARARTPADHLRVGEAFACRGQLFGNDSKAFEHYLIAAKGGDIEAQSRIGDAYLFRHYGVPRDREQARYWLTKAASQGHASAAQMLNSVDTVP